MSSTAPPTDIPAEELSRVIGLIYDCAVDPERWPVALEAMGGLIGARMSSIAIYDPSKQTARFARYWGADPDWQYWIKLFEEKYAALMPFYAVMEDVPAGEPINTASMMQLSGRNDFYETEFYKGWGEPAGLKDVVAAIILKSPTINCALNIHTPLEADYVGPREIEIVRILVPHVRRAVLISNMLDMRALEAESVKSTLDLLSAAVVLTDGEGNVVHANAAARLMLQAGDPIQITFDKLTVRNEDAATALSKAIARAASEESAMGSSGIGVPVPFADGRPALAHVMPLATPPLRSQLAPSVKAAVFISTTDAQQPPVEALSALFELTAAEQKVLASVLDGRNQAETAEHLKIAESTVKTHLGRIFSKTHTTNQAELAQIADRLAMPACKRESLGAR
jgi:DNA-binding CsgD family transcriptional regulator/PAS domain-containing protein